MVNRENFHFAASCHSGIDITDLAHRFRLEVSTARRTNNGMFAKGVILFRYISHGKDLLANGAETIGNKFHKKHPLSEKSGCGNSL